MARFLLFCVALANSWMLGFMHLPVPSPAPSEGGIIAGNPGIRRMASHHPAKFAAGGDVILGGFLVTLVAVVFFYIRATRQNQRDHS
ncbi:hypothetical protein MANES_17G030800v8 [Manihot esculenta]|uniref:Uncharacterized protein n=1 Tax=Manihot esculenta TaxID=3983 RepID=A0A2C9U467_MANES|nr:hypothetical protein MANES_17G030800v8 [Manihot esculenta]